MHVVQKTLLLSRSGFKHANCLLSLTRCQSIPASVPSSISWMNARYEATTVGREMWITYIIRFVLSSIKVLKTSRLFRQDQDQDFYFKTKTKTIFHVLEAPRDKDQGLETTSLRSANYTFGKVGRIASEELILNLTRDVGQCPT